MNSQKEKWKEKGEKRMVDHNLTATVVTCFNDDQSNRSDCFINVRILLNIKEFVALSYSSLPNNNISILRSISLNPEFV